MNISFIPPILILFDLYDYTKDDRYLKAIKYTYNELCKMPKTVNGINYSHKEAYLNQIWLDGNKHKIYEICAGRKPSCCKFI